MCVDGITHMTWRLIEPGPSRSRPLDRQGETRLARLTSFFPICMKAMQIVLLRQRSARDLKLTSRVFAWALSLAMSSRVELIVFCCVVQHFVRECIKLGIQFGGQNLQLIVPVIAITQKCNDIELLWNDVVHFRMISPLGLSSRVHEYMGLRFLILLTRQDPSRARQPPTFQVQGYRGVSASTACTILSTAR